MTNKDKWINEISGTIDEDDLPIIEDFEIVSNFENLRNHYRFESINILDKSIPIEIYKLLPDNKISTPVSSKILDISEWGIRVWKNLNLTKWDIVYLQFNLWPNHSFKFKYEFLRNDNETNYWKSSAFRYLDNDKDNDKEKKLELIQVLWSIKHRQVPWYKY